MMARHYPGLAHVPRRGQAILGLILLALIYSAVGSLLASRSLARDAPAVEPARPSEAAPFERFVAFALSTVPEDAAYLFQEPWEYGRAHHLRYALYPRRYERLAIEATEEEVQQFVRANAIGYILVADAALYPAGSWVFREQPWFERLSLTADTFILRVRTD